jgi:hypothetical protein
VFENRVLRGMFASEREEVTGGWTKLLNDKLYEVCFPPDVIRKVKLGTMSGVCSTHGRSRMPTEFCRKTERKRPLEVPRYR